MLGRITNQMGSLLTGPRKRLVLTTLGAAALMTLTLLMSHRQGYMDLSQARPGWTNKPIVHGQGEPIVFSLITRGNDTAYETEVLLKVSVHGFSDQMSSWLMADGAHVHFLTCRLSSDRRRHIAKTPHDRARVGEATSLQCPSLFLPC